MQMSKDRRRKIFVREAFWTSIDQSDFRCIESMWRAGGTASLHPDMAASAD